MVSPQITNLAVMLGAMQFSRRVSLDDPDNLFYARIAYAVSNVLIIIAYALIYNSIQKKKDLSTLKYVEPPSAFQQDAEEKVVTTTVKEYDTSELVKAVRGNAMGIAMMLVMHLYFKFTQPLLVQSILPLKGVLENNLAKIHLWGQKPEGELKRPFKVAAMFGQSAPTTSVEKKKA